MLKGAQASAPEAERAVRRPDDLRQRPALTEAIVGRSSTTDSPDWRGVAGSKRIAGGRDLEWRGYPAGLPRSAPTLRWRIEGLEHLDAVMRQRPAADHGVLARPHPARDLLLPRAAASSSSPARTSTASGLPASSSASATARRADRRRAAAAGAAAVDARPGGRAAGGVHRRRSARSGPGRPAGRRLAGEGDRQSGPAVSLRGRPPTGRCEAGTAPRSRSRLRRSRSRRRAVRRARAEDAVEDAPAGPSLVALEARPGDAESAGRQQRPVSWKAT